MQHHKFKVGERVKVTLPGGILPDCEYIGRIVGLDALEKKEPTYIVLTDGRKLLRRVLQRWIEPI